MSNQHSNLENKYKKTELHNHILAEPDSYVGSIKKKMFTQWIYNDTEKMMEKKQINVANGLYKIFDEVLVNAHDHWIRLKYDPEYNKTKFKVTTIKIDIDPPNNSISVFNDGDGIPVQMHPTENKYIPELILGDLLTSGNYDKKKKLTGGKNGYGAKLANIFSEEFTVETLDAVTKKRYIQRFADNMFTVGKPKITPNSGKPYTKITYKPDLAKFGYTELDEDIVGWMKTRHRSVRLY